MQKTANPNLRKPANLSLNPVLKAAAIRYGKDKGVSVSQMTERLLARKLIEGGYLTETDEGYAPSTTRPLTTARKGRK